MITNYSILQLQIHHNLLSCFLVPFSHCSHHWFADEIWELLLEVGDSLWVSCLYISWCKFVISVLRTIAEYINTTRFLDLGSYLFHRWEVSCLRFRQPTRDETFRDEPWSVERPGRFVRAICPWLDQALELLISLSETLLFVAEFNLLRGHILESNSILLRLWCWVGKLTFADRDFHLDFELGQHVSHDHLFVRCLHDAVEVYELVVLRGDLNETLSSQQVDLTVVGMSY